MKTKKLDKGILKEWLLIGGLIFFLLIVSSVILIILLNGNKTFFTPVMITDIILLIIAGSFCFIYPILRHKFYTYFYDDKHIIIKRGIIFKKEILIPICQIQDIHIIEGPFDLIFKVSKVEISTAGSNYIIVGINKKDARIMINELENNLLIRLEENKNE